MNVSVLMDTIWTEVSACLVASNVKPVPTTSTTVTSVQPKEPMLQPVTNVHTVSSTTICSQNVSFVNVLTTNVNIVTDLNVKSVNKTEIYLSVLVPLDTLK
jgi:hypothetical protein